MVFVPASCHLSCILQFSDLSFFLLPCPFNFGAHRDSDIFHALAIGQCYLVTAHHCSRSWSSSTRTVRELGGVELT